MFLEIILGLLTALVLWDFIRKRKHNKAFKEIGLKTPPSFPLIGSTEVFLNVTPETYMDVFSDCCKKYGSTWFFWVLNEVSIVTADTGLIEAILTSNQVITKNNDYDVIRNWVGDGLLLSTGKKWHQRRKIITPTFHFKILEQFVEVFDRQGAKCVDKLSKFADGKTVVDVFPKMCLTALDIISETSMGVSINAQDDPNFPYAKAVTTTSEISIMRIIKPYLQNDIVMRFVAPKEFKKLNECIKLMHDFADKVIRDRRTALEKSIADGSFKANDDEGLGSKKRMALLDLLLQSNIDGKPLSNEDIREEVDTFMFAGHDTTTCSMAHTLYLLSRHPDVQTKLFEEIRSVLGDDKNSPISMHDLNELKYLECVIKESLRLHPPAATMARLVTEDVVLDGKLIPANTSITILTYHALRNPEYFPEPNAFKPERFEISSGTKINPFAYIPFSAGPRNCIGQKFAMYEMKVVVSKIIRHFELCPLGENIRPFMSIVLRSTNGCQIGLKPRVY